jgi:hypothetical protein
MRTVLTVILACALLPVASTATWAALPSGQCDVTTGGGALPACPAGNPGNVTNTPPNADMVAVTTVPNLALGITTTYQAVRSDMGAAAVPIDVYDLCRYVDNKSTGKGTSIFVPFNTSNEWAQFLNAATKGAISSYISLEHCSTPAVFTISAGPGCNPVPPATAVPSQQANFPYAPYDLTTHTGASDSVTLTFDCTDASGNPWKETATVPATGLDSDVTRQQVNPPEQSWEEGIVTYSPAPVTGAYCVCMGDSNGCAVGSSYSCGTSIAVSPGSEPKCATTNPPTCTMVVEWFPLAACNNTSTTSGPGACRLKFVVVGD